MERSTVRGRAFRLGLLILALPLAGDATRGTAADQRVATYETEPAGRVPIGPACPGGRFELDTNLTGSRDDAAVQTLFLIGGQLELSGACPAVAAELTMTPGGLRVRASWPACRTLPAGAQLTGIIDAATCSRFEGVFSSGDGRAAQPFGARLGSCAELTRSMIEFPSADEAPPCGPEDVGPLAYQRFLAAFHMRAAPRGVIPQGALRRAFGETRLAAPAPGNWIPLGPSPILEWNWLYNPHVTQWGEMPQTAIYSGRVDAIAVDPINGSHWLLGAATGGVWETFNSGLTWHPRTDDQPSLSIGAIAFAPGGLGVAYAGTGNRTASGFGYQGVGLLRSVDNGTTWSLVGASTFERLNFSAIAVSNTDAATIVAATLTLDHYAQFPAPGVYRSTSAGGSWQLRLAGHATDLVAHPTDFARQYAALGRQYKPGAPPAVSPENGLYRSFDSGQTWTAVAGPWTAKAGGVGETRLAIAPSLPSVLYVSVRDAVDGQGKDHKLLGLWKTTDAWAPVPSWTEIPWNGDGSPGYLHNPGDHVITVHPSSPDIVYAGSFDLWKYAGGQWTNISDDGPVSSLHVDQKALAWGPLRQLLVGNDGGIYGRDELLDGSWSSRNSNLSITQFWAGGAHPSAPLNILGGTQDNGIVKPAAGLPNTWVEVRGGDGTGAFFGSNPQHSAAWRNDIKSIYRSRDDWQTVGNTEVTWASVWSQSGAIDQQRAWLAPAAVCPANEDVVLAATRRLWRSENFFSVPGPLDVTWATNSTDIGVITAVAFAPSDPTCQTYAVASNKEWGAGKISFTVNGGGTWLEIDSGAELPDRYVAALAFSPINKHTVYVVLAGFNESTPGKPGHVFRRTLFIKGNDAGWKNIGPPVNISHNALAIDPSNPQRLYVGTDLGVWTSGNGGASWSYYGPAGGLPNAPVRALTIDPCGVNALTYGRGAFRLVMTPCE